MSEKNLVCLFYQPHTVTLDALRCLFTFLVSFPAVLQLQDFSPDNTQSPFLSYTVSEVDPNVTVYILAKP